MSFISLNSYRTPDFVCPNCKTTVLINTNARQQQGRANPFHELVKLGFRFSAKASCLLASIRREHKSSGQGDHTRTLLLIRLCKRHVEQSPLSPKSLRQALLVRYKRARERQT